MKGKWNQAIRVVMGVLLLASVSQTRTSAQATERMLGLRSIGPAVMGGRVDDVAVDEARPWTMFVGTASGGLWKTSNYGTTWTSLFDDQPSPSIGDVALSRSDPDVVWVGTGEPNNRQSSTFGNGVYRSDDGGRRFRHMGLEQTRHIARVLVHPNDSLTVYVAAAGNLWAASPERGVFRTRDGGVNWEKVLYIDDDTGVIDMIMDPRNPNILFAVAYQRRRAPWGFVGGGTGSGLHKSTDGGNTWRRIEEGLPSGPMGRLGIDIYRRDPNIIFLTVEHRDAGGVYRSRDRGESWERVNELNPRPMYYSKIRIDPNDEDRLYLLSSAFYVSSDGGRSFRRNTSMTPTYDVGVHGDHHALWIDPSNSGHLILGGDGGMYLSWDRGENWDKVNNIPLGQFYGIAVDNRTPYRIYAGAQDTHSWFGPSATRRQIGILNDDWLQTNFGDGMYQQADPEDPRIVFTSSQGGNIVRLDARTGGRKSLKPFPEEGQDSFRFHWTAPILISPGRSTRLYLGGNRLFISDDRGEQWRATEDLTWNEDRDELPIMGAIPDENTLSRHDGVAEWGTITTIAESTARRGLLFVGTDDGRIQRSDDDGQSWTSLEENVPGIEMRRSKLSRIVASHHRAERVFAAVDRHHLGDFRPYLFVSEDRGETWRSLSRGLPVEGWINVLVEHPDNASLLFVGTETGLFVSMDGGASYSRMREGFPTVPVDDLVIHPREKDLVVGTHGRSIYILDDTTPLAEYDPDDRDVQLFSVRGSQIFMPWKNESYGAQRQFIGQNPQRGALISFHVPSGFDANVRIEIRDAAGATVSVPFEAKPESAGFHRVVWDLREEAPVGVEGARGTFVRPGQYRVRLTTGEKVIEHELDVSLDPAADVSVEEFGRRHEFMREINASRAQLAAARTRVDALRKELQRVREGIEDVGEADGLRSRIDSVDESLEGIASSWERNAVNPFRNPSDLASLGRLFSELSGDEVRQGTLSAPTPTQVRRLTDLVARTSARLAELERVVSEELGALNEALSESVSLRILVSP